MVDGGSITKARCLLIASSAVVLGAAAGCDAWDPRPPPDRGALDAETIRLLNEKDPTRPRAEEAPARAPALHRVYARARFVWIRPRPKDGDEWLGYLTQGQDVAVRGDRTTWVAGTGSTCETWVPIEPKGWVCLGRDATLDRTDELYRTLASSSARIDSAWPFDYAQSLGAPRYRTIPTKDDQARRESSHLARLARAKRAESPTAIAAFDKNLAQADLSLTGEPAPAVFRAPFTVLEGDEDVPLGSTVAYTAEFDHEDRAFVLTSDHAVVPLSRLKRYPRSDFRGVELGKEAHLPGAFFRRGGRPTWKRSAGGAMTRTGSKLPPRGYAALTGATVTEGGRRFLETKTADWVDDKDVIVVEPQAKVPRALPDEGRRTWVEVSTLGGWLVAFEGERPVFTTLISAGRGDLRPDNTMIDASATPNGTFTVGTKLRAANMRSENRPGRIHAEVMFTQVFHEAFALHGAYWHDEFGDRKSAGCVNLSPIDAKWLFDWSEPQLPDGWHAMTARAGDGATIVVIHP